MSEKKELIDLILKKSYKEGKFTLASGQESNFYIDLKNVTLFPKGLDIICKLTWSLLNPSELGGVGGPTLGADPIVTALSIAAFEKGFEVPAFIIRKEPKKHGTSQWIEGVDSLQKSKEVLLVEDVVTTGGSGLKALERLRAEGFKVTRALAVLDRNQGASEAFAKEGVRLVSLLNIEDVLKAKR